MESRPSQGAAVPSREVALVGTDGAGREDWHFGGVEASGLHAVRLQAVAAALVAAGCRSVLDVGCGSGLLLERLAEHPRFERLVGLDSDGPALRAARDRLSPHGGRVVLVAGSLFDLGAGVGPFDAVVLVEVIEHFEPGQLSAVERQVFGRLAPRLVAITTPNREWNGRLGLAAGRLRHPDHRFEWDRARFRAWAGGVARRAGAAVEIRQLGTTDAELGGPSQMALFRRAEGHRRDRDGARGAGA